MNWDMMGALGELVGAVAVVLTLSYLAHQVREASKEAQRNRWGDLNSEISRVADSWGGNDELSEIVVSAGPDMLFGRHVDQLGGDPQSIVDPAHTSL